MPDTDQTILAWLVSDTSYIEWLGRSGPGCSQPHSQALRSDQGCWLAQPRLSGYKGTFRHQIISVLRLFDTKTFRTKAFFVYYHIQKTGLTGYYNGWNIKSFSVTIKHPPLWSGNRKQVAQRATIAHLSPMCQGQSAPKPYAAFPPPQWCYTLNLIKIGQLVSEIFKFKSVKF